MSNDSTNPTPPSTGSTAPLAFRLGPNLQSGAAATRSVAVCEISDATCALFVDGVAGSDSTGDGSPLRPFASLAGALRVAAGIGRPDVYIATLAA